MFTISIVSLGHFLAIRHPITYRRISGVAQVRTLIFLTWCFSTTVMIPLILVRSLYVVDWLPSEHFAFCTEQWPSPVHRQVYDIILFVCVYIIPGVTMIVSYSFIMCRLCRVDALIEEERGSTTSNHDQQVLAERRKVARMLMVLALLFAISWLPYNIVALQIDFLSPETTTDYMNYVHALHFSLLLAHSHSAYNPILYCFMHKTFFQDALRLFKRSPADKESAVSI